MLPIIIKIKSICSDGSSDDNIVIKKYYFCNNFYRIRDEENYGCAHENGRWRELFYIPNIQIIYSTWI